MRFVGRVSDNDLPKLFASAHLFVLPANARSEAFGKVLLEAMAAGLPCITTEVGTGTSFVVRDGETGRVVPPKRPDLLATAVNDLIVDHALRLKMGQAGQARAVNEFSVMRMVQSVEAVYRNVLDSS